MWEVKWMNLQESSKPNPVALFFQKQDAEEYINYLKTEGIKAWAEELDAFIYRR